MKELRYYLRLYSINVSRSLVARMEYKSDLFIGIFVWLYDASDCGGPSSDG